MDKIVINSSAKINIGLKILNKRLDGYHNLETIFYPLLLSDVLYFTKADHTIIESNSDDIKSLKNNLILEAIDLLEEYVQFKLNVLINIEKNIPIGAGLGGGSSNAATTLKALNKIFNLNLTYNELFELALSLGSDTPYFLNPLPCYATSRGELMKPIMLSLSNPILLINPGIHISTRWAFENIDIKEDNHSLEKLAHKSVITLDDIKLFASNDFEEVVFKSYPIIKEIKDELNSLGAEFSLMTGTGSTIYGIFKNLQKARWTQQEFEQRFFTYLNYPINEGSIT